MIRQAVVLAFVGGLVGLSAQAPAGQSAPAFEVASVKRNLDPRFLRFSILPGGQLIVQGYALASIIQHAFGVSGVQVSGIPEWARTERFDITAKAANEAAGTPEVLALLRTLLQTRFTLRTRVEIRELPIYSLTLARADRTLGLRLLSTDTDCSGFVPGRSEVPEPNDGPQCVIAASRSPSSPAMTFRLRGRSMAKLAADLQIFANRPVRDDTGLGGRFDVEIAFTPQLPDVPASSGNEGISLFTAVQEQLGLKLEPARGPVEVLVIDSVERPTPD